MAITRNKLIPLLGIVAVAIVGTIVWKQMTSNPQKPAAGPLMQSVPKAELPATKGADRDTPQETLSTVVASNRELRDTATQLIEENRKLRREMETERNRPGVRSLAVVDGPTAPAGLPAPQDHQKLPAAPSVGTVTPSAQPEPGVMDVFSKAFDQASTMADKIGNGTRPIAAPTVKAGPGGAAARPAGGHQAGGAPVDPNEPQPDGAVVYKTRPPMGYALHTTQARGREGVATSQYVRLNGAAGAPAGAGGGAATRAAQAAQDKPQTVPFYTIPENATLAGVVSMTSLIGRVPIDGRVTDPMQWKAVVGRDNLAANGFELPDDLAGMIVSGIAIGDMALSCSEGKVRSLTFVFNDGTIRTVSTRRGGGGQGTVRTGTNSGGANSTDLGYISDQHGNPCISGKFVTNAPAYLTDIVGMKTLEVAGQAFSDAQRTVSQISTFGTTSSAVTGSVGSYALGQAVAGASDEVSKWLMARLKNSFDAVVTPSGQRMVIHLDTEIRLDKVPDARLLVHGAQNPSSITARGAHHGLE
jgi:hypothetical protein